MNYSTFLLPSLPFPLLWREWKQTVLSILFLSVFPIAAFAADDEETSPAVLDLQRAITLTDATMEKSFTGNSLRMYDTYDTATGTGSGTADVWPYTAALEAHCSVIEALQLLRDEAPDLYAEHHDRFVERLRKLYDNLAYYAGSYTLSSYAHVGRWTIYGVHRGGTKGMATVKGIENVYDDQMWICRELVRAYRLTGEEIYLKEATMLANYCIDGWDCCLDAAGNEYGGISWGPGYNSKHSCSNAPLIQPLVWLADIYRTDDEAEDLRYYYILADGTRESRLRRHSEVYLEMARKIYDWQKSKLLNTSTGVYWDMCGAVTGEIQYVRVGRYNYRDHVDLNGPSGTAYTYNSGTMLAGAAELYRATAESRYLDDLNALARSCFSRFTNGRRINGVVYREWPTDEVATSGFNTWFDNVLMRAYVDVAPYNTSPTPTALNSFHLNLNYAWQNHLRDGFLPIHLIDGWGEATVTKGFHQLAFAAELAMLAVWQYRTSHPDGIREVTSEASSYMPTRGHYYDLAGRYAPLPLRPGIYILGGRKVVLQ